METILDSSEHSSLGDGHFHDASRHGPVWALINKMLHLIVLGYSLYGMIRFKVKFIHMVRLVKLISFITIAHSWYLSVKFAFMACIMYLFNIELESMKISLSQFNCSLLNDLQLFDIRPLEETEAMKGFVHGQNLRANPHDGLLIMASNDTDQQLLVNRLSHLSGSLVERVYGAQERQQSSDLTTHYPTFLARLLDLFGGPYKLLGNRATLMYGFYAIAIFIMLAIFPIELLYLHVGFNYIRFVLNDTNCMRDLYMRKRKHLDRLNNWSRNQNSSLLTLSMKKVINQRKLRCLYAFETTSASPSCKALATGPANQVGHSQSSTTLKLDYQAYGGGKRSNGNHYIRHYISRTN